MQVINLVIFAPSLSTHLRQNELSRNWDGRSFAVVAVAAAAVVLTDGASDDDAIVEMNFDDDYYDSNDDGLQSCCSCY